MWQVWLPGGGFVGSLLYTKGLGGSGPFWLASEFDKVVMALLCVQGAGRI